MLLNWNKTHNLIAKSQAPLLNDHIQDSLTVVEHVSKNVIDLGSGGGFPGIPLALASNKKSIFLIESNTKKASFLLHAVNVLGLQNTKVFNERAEKINPLAFPRPVDIIARAFGTPKKTAEASKRILDTPGAKLKIMSIGGRIEGEVLPGYEVTGKQKLLTKPHYKERFLVTIEKTN